MLWLLAYSSNFTDVTLQVSKSKNLFLHLCIELVITIVWNFSNSQEPPDATRDSGMSNYYQFLWAVIHSLYCSHVRWRFLIKYDHLFFNRGVIVHGRIDLEKIHSYNGQFIKLTSPLVKKKVRKIITLVCHVNSSVNLKQSETNERKK